MTRPEKPVTSTAVDEKRRDFVSTSFHPAGYALIGLVAVFHLGMPWFPNGVAAPGHGWTAPWGLANALGKVLIVYILTRLNLSYIFDRYVLRMTREGIEYRNWMLRSRRIPWNRVDAIHGPRGWVAACDHVPGRREPPPRRRPHDADRAAVPWDHHCRRQSYRPDLMT